MATPNAKLATRKPNARSRVSNGADVLPGVDGRSLVARRYRDITAAILTDQGGLARCAEARLQLIRRFAACAVLAEAMEARLANGETIDITQHCALTSSMVRCASRIGINRHLREIVPSLAGYIDMDDGDPTVSVDTENTIIENDG